MMERRHDPGPTGSQYEADQRKVRARRIVTTWLLAAVSVLAILAVVQLYDIRSSQHEACDQATNTVIESVRQEFRDLKRPLIDLYLGVASASDNPEAKELLIQAADGLRERRRTIDDRLPLLPCDALYQPLPFQDFD